MFLTALIFSFNPKNAAGKNKINVFSTSTDPGHLNNVILMSIKVTMGSSEFKNMMCLLRKFSMKWN